MSEDADQALDALQVAIDRLDAAARDDFIRPGTYVYALAEAIKILSLAQLEGLRQTLVEGRGNLAAARVTADTLFEAGRRALEESRTELRKLDRYVEMAEAKVEEKLAESARRIATAIRDEVRTVMVIRERDYTLQRRARLAAVGAAGALGLMLAGMVLERFVLGDAAPWRAWETCHRKAAVARDGRTYCLLELTPDGPR